MLVPLKIREFQFHIIQVQTMAEVKFDSLNLDGHGA